MADLPPPISHLGRYDIVRVLGQGAMGVVYEGRDPNLDRRVAIKTVRVVGMAANEVAEYEQRFKTEARSAGRLQHPNIVSVYDSDKHVDATGQTAYIVMEFVQGEDLKHFLDKGKRFSLEQTAFMMADLLAALSYAHQHKIIHRDIKPANMLLTKEGRIKLTDFGVARITDSGEATKTSGGTVGTLKYMSPEQVAGKGVDHSSDLFSAGIVLYQLLTGVRPFDGEGYLDIVSKIVKEDPTPPSQIVGALPPSLDAVVAKALLIMPI
jgi:eukaryotic-like serine/threonine-protein kinase